MVSIEQAQSLRKTLRVAVWILVCLVVLDVLAVGLFDRGQVEPRKMSRPQLYLFEGRAIETKLRAMAPFAEASASALRAGWVDDVYQRAELVPGASPGARSATIYGLSFSNQVGRALAAQEPGLSLRLVSGPAAPLSHSVYAYERDPEVRSMDIAVVGVLLDQLPALRAMHEGGVSFRLPHAYQLPRYRLEASELVLVEPVLRSFADFEHALAVPSAWAGFRDQLSADDDYFHGAVFDARPPQRSFVLGLARRSWARHRQLAIERGWESDPDSEVLATARALLSRFADLARAREQRVLVVLFNARGHAPAEHALAGHLARIGVPHVSSSPICPVTDARNFVGDGHFTERCNQALARAVAAELKRTRP